jgi:hypothetical protein
MKQKLLLLLFLLVSSLSEAQNLVDTVRTNITTNTTWRRDRIYLIEGYRFVKDGATLTIEPGTTIRGDKASKGTLIITKTGKILANHKELELMVTGEVS